MSKHDQQCLLSWSRAAGLAYGGLVLSIVLLWLSLAPSRQGIQRAPTRRSPPTGGRAIDGDPRPVARPATRASRPAMSTPGHRPGRRGRRQGFSPSPTDRLRRLFDAIRLVESGGDSNAVGDGGTSLGAYQIGADYWHDAVRWGRVQWDYAKRVRSQPHCEQVMLWFWDRYGAATDEQRARMHAGGPDGPRQPCTLAYWQKIRRAMGSTDD